MTHFLETVVSSTIPSAISMLPDWTADTTTGTHESATRPIAIWVREAPHDTEAFVLKCSL